MKDYVYSNNNRAHLSHCFCSNREKGIQIGTTKVFLQQRGSDGLEWLRNKKMAEAIAILQKAARAYIFIIRLSKAREEKNAIKIQSCARRFIATRDVQILVLQIYSATVIEAHQRGFVQRAQYKVMLDEKRQAEAAKEAKERKQREVGS